MKNFKLIKNLCYSGLIPFYFLSITNLYHYNFIIVDLFSLYSLVILSFLFGSAWLNLLITPKKKADKILLIIVILSPIFLLMNEILSNIKLKFFIYGLFYLIIFYIDKEFIQNKEYLKVRKNLTINVSITYLIFLFSIYSNSI